MRKFLLVLSLIICSSAAFAQSSEFLFTDVKQFLQRMETKGALPLSAYNHFLTQSEMRSQLLSIDTTRLSAIEKDQLHYLLQKDFTYKSGKSLVSNNVVNGFKTFLQDEKEEFFEHRDSMFSMRIRPALNLSFNRTHGETQQWQSWGWSMQGLLGENIEFRMDFMDNALSANKYDYTWNYNNIPGRIYSRKSNGNFQFSETNGSLLYHNSFITIGFTKEKMELGNGIRGQLVLSDKAPSFPSFYMKLSPADWLNIYSMHGWLISGVTDTANSYTTAIGPRTVEYDKYYVMHAVQFFPTADFSLTLGETIIYSDRSIYAGYFIPFLFYRSVDHQFSFGSGESGNNGSIFLETSVRPIKNFTAYFSLYIDEFSLTEFLHGDNSRNQTGYTIGFKSYPLSVGNIEFNAEYTKILPWVYSNWIPTQTYRNAGYILGHYIGQNADQLYMELLYTPSYKTYIKLFGEAIRRGGFGNIKNQYDTVGEPFLYGPRMNETNLGIEASYEFLYNTYVRASYEYTKLTDQDLTRTPSWMQGVSHSLAFSVSYGF
jgi:hypothetical protein